MESPSGHREAEPAAAGNAKAACPKCGTAVDAADGYCGECGAKVGEAALSGAERLWSDEVDASVKKASKWILAVGFMFIVFGTIMGFVQKGARDKALANLAQYADTSTWSAPINGKTVTVAELRKMVDFEYYSVFGLNYFLAIVMFVIFRWSRNSPFSAFVTALAVYLGVMVLSAVVDPKTLIQGVIVKIAVIAALMNGIKAAIPTRGLTRGAA